MQTARFASMISAGNVPHVLAGQTVSADWWVRSSCGSVRNAQEMRATLVLQFRVMPAHASLNLMLETISSCMLLLVYDAAACLAVIDVPDPVPVSVVNALAQLPALRWLEPDCDYFSRLHNHESA